MPAYVVALIGAITDAEAYGKYVAQVEATLAPFGGRFLARKPGPEALEGKDVPGRAVVLAFPSEAQARAWHASPAYQPVMRLRQGASTGTLLLLPGYGEAAPPLGDVVYVEHVSTDPEATRATLERAHGWTFAPPDPAVGGARVALLPSGARAAVRAPLREDERPVTRSYVRVADADAAAKAAAEAGAVVALSPMPIEGHGRVAIVLAGGVELGLWERA